MPIYDFRCGECRNEFEALCKTTASDGVKCPSCGGTRLSRLISRFAMSRSLTPCGTPASDAAGTCGYNARTGGCGCCAERG